MAIFHLRMKKSKRGSKYTPPAAHLDYINRDEKYDKKEDLLFKEVMNLPEEFNDIKDFWKCAETYERKNSNLYRELEISLPREFTPEENKKMVDGFCENLFGKEYVYNYAIHNPKSFDGDMQPHVHIMFFERKIDDIKREKDKYFKRYNSKNIEKGGWRKDKKWNERSTLKNIRKEWETFLNFELEKKGIEKVSAKSLKDQKRDAENNNDYKKVYELNREAINIDGKILYRKESELSDKEKVKKRIFIKSRILKAGTDLMKKLLEKLKKLEREYEDLKRDKIGDLENLEKLRGLEESIRDIKKKMSKDKIENTVYNLMTDKKYYKFLNENKKIDKELKNIKEKNRIKYLKITKEKNLKNLESLRNEIQNDWKKKYIFDKRVENIREKYLRKIANFEDEKDTIYENLKEKNIKYNDEKNGLYNINHLQFIYEKNGLKEINRIEKELKKLVKELDKNEEIVSQETLIKDKYSNYEFSKLEKNIAESKIKIEGLQKELNKNLDISEQKYYLDWLKREVKIKEDYEARKENIEIKIQKKLQDELLKNGNSKVQEREKVKKIIKNIEAIKVLYKKKRLSEKRQVSIKKWNRKKKSKSLNGANYDKNLGGISGDFRMEDMEVLDELER
ncbi:MobA/MobL family protein [Leptotrichia sp. oral taxon 879]|uniref:MobA/MobL family protein n=1 Tax=Leptotrichia sp. oral taxon 879 TaxID=1227267 RepID=UPI0003AD90C0|nr:MobA/MobL family protein [Leptotrichia sp. oral taxon 879]ERK55837.1 MobA/MobL family protein [Leptotrichia sp. oral taxon 879 str. F0557]